MLIAFDDNAMLSYFAQNRLSFLGDKRCKGFVNSVYALLRTGEKLNVDEKFDGARHNLGHCHPVTQLWKRFAGLDARLIKCTDRLHPLIIALTAHDRLRIGGVHPARVFPLVEEYGLKDCHAVMSGSWLYGLSDECSSDFDLHVLTNEPRPTVDGALDATIRTWTPDTLAHDLVQGKRHAWELLMAPRDCWLKTSDDWQSKLDRMREYACQRFMRDRTPWWKASIEYQVHWGKLIDTPIENCPDPSIALWVAENGWAYKIGYYILVDFLIAQHAVRTGVFDCRAPFADQKISMPLLRCKQGQMTRAEWDALFVSLPN